MNLTRWLILFFVVVILAVDIALAVFGGVGATISFQITRWSYDYPAIPFAAGFLMGHWFGGYGLPAVLKSESKRGAS